MFQGLSDDFFRPISKEVFGPLIKEVNALRFVDRDDCVMGKLENRSEAGFRFGTGAAQAGWMRRMDFNPPAAACSVYNGAILQKETRLPG